MESETAFLTLYRCPRCHAGLSAWTVRRAHWLRCPNCGRGGLPPDNLTEEARPKAKARPVAAGGTFILHPDDQATNGHAAQRSRRGAARTGSLWRIVLATGTFLSALLTVFALLDGSASAAVGFALIGVICISVLILARR